MNIRTKFVSATIIGLMTTASLGTIAMAETAAKPAVTAAKPAPAYKTQEAMLKTADEALIAITRVHAARLALFNNNIEEAKTRLAEATKALKTSEKDLASMAITDIAKPESSTKYLPFDMSMGMTEGFTVTEEHRSVLEKAVGLFQKGSRDEAREVLRLAAIDVNISTALLPIDETTKNLAEATKLVDEGKYFEANLALKAIEDGVIVRDFLIDQIPAQG